MMGWGDCPLGCTSYKGWYYSVYPGCMVTLDSTRQEVWTSGWPLGCVSVEVQEKEQGKVAFEVFPNPAADIIHIKVSAAATERYDYKLYNGNGAVILSGNFLNNTQLNLAGLPKGIYLLQVRNKTGNTGLQKILLQ